MEEGPNSVDSKTAAYRKLTFTRLGSKIKAECALHLPGCLSDSFDGDPENPNPNKLNPIEFIRLNLDDSDSIETFVCDSCLEKKRPDWDEIR